jgi:hypothetical protein
MNSNRSPFSNSACVVDVCGAGHQEAGPGRRVGGDGAIEALVIDDQEVLAGQHSVPSHAG